MQELVNIDEQRQDSLPSPLSAADGETSTLIGRGSREQKHGADGKFSSRGVLALAFVGGALFAAAVMILVRPHASAVSTRPAIPPLDPEKSCPYYSPTFPSEGGPDCPCECAPGTRSAAAAYFGVFPPDYNARVAEAGRIVYGLAPDATIYVEGEGQQLDSHITFSYYCCQTEDELSAIKSVLERVEWEAVNTSFSRVTCAMDGPGLDHVSLILLLDVPSNARMMERVGGVERRIAEEAGISLTLQRSRQEPFHTTIAVVNGSSYPVAKAVKILNDRYQGAAGWTEKPVTLVKPCEAHGNKPAGFFC